MLKTRIITALILITAFLPTLFMSSNIVWAIITLAISLLAVYEWGNLVDLSPIATAIYTLVCGVLGGFFIYLMADYGFHWFIYQSLFAFMVTLAFWLLVVPVLMTKFIVIKNKLLLALLGFCLLAPLWFALVSAKGADPWLLLALLATIWIADTAAYFSGKKFGKRKLAPSISPGKTWEGVIGALIGVSFFACALYFSGLAHSLALLPLLLLVTLLGVVGDLFESLIKRQVNKKDSGNLLPGHGGILDRIDGLLPSLPIAVLMIYLFNYFQVGS